MGSGFPCKIFLFSILNAKHMIDIRCCWPYNHQPREKKTLKNNFGITILRFHARFPLRFNRLVLWRFAFTTLWCLSNKCIVWPVDSEQKHDVMYGICSKPTTWNNTLKRAIVANRFLGFQNNKHGVFQISNKHPLLKSVSCGLSFAGLRSISGVVFQFFLLKPALKNILVTSHSFSCVTSCSLTEFCDRKVLTYLRLETSDYNIPGLSPALIWAHFFI